MLLIKFKCTVKNPTGIHARPAGYLAAIAKKFSNECRILLRKNVEDSENYCDASSVLSIMGENFKCGDNVFVQVIFNDENKSDVNKDIIIQELNNILEKHF